MAIATLSALTGAVLVVAIASTDFTKVPAGVDRIARVVTTVAMVFVCVGWAACTSHVGKVAAASEARAGAARLKSALTTYPDECARAGLTQLWYDAVHATVSRLAVTGLTGLTVVFILAICCALPSSLTHVVCR